MELILVCVAIPKFSAKIKIKSMRKIRLQICCLCLHAHEHASAIVPKLTRTCKIPVLAMYAI